MSSRYWFTLLGPLQAWRDGVQLRIGPPQQRAVLAILLLHAGTPVPLHSLVDALWETNPPQSASMTVRSYIHRLRRVLTSQDDAAGLIETVGDGYLIRVESQDTDLGSLRGELADADAARRAGDDDEADRRVRAALAHWQGGPLAGLPDAVAEPHRVGLRALHRSAVEARFNHDLNHGDCRRAAAELAASVADDPLDERFRELLMLALYRSGRQAEALSVYRDGQTVLADVLGVDPGPALQMLHQRILAADAGLIATETPAVEVSPARDVTPRQLPADLAVFTGRAPELAQLRAVLVTPGAPRVVVVSGTAGVGKTTFATRWAHEHASWFPDGQVHLNLHGFDRIRPAVSPTAAVRTVLESLGVPPGEIPAEVQACGAYYRSVVADRRVLVVADNAADADQVRALVPAGPGSMLLITSRAPLLGLIATEGAAGLTLSVLSGTDARRMLAGRLGDQRLAAEPEATARILDCCAGLPLALAIVAARVANRATVTLERIADELTESSEALDGFRLGDPGVDAREVFSWSYRELSDGAARLFRLLALNPAPDNTVATGADLTAQPPPLVQRLFEELQQAHLVTEHSAGRYTTHDLLRAYATELHREIDSPADRLAATDRLYAGIVGRACQAAVALAPHEMPSPFAPEPGSTPGGPVDQDAASAWFGAEHAGLLALIRGAAERDTLTACRLAWAFDRFLDRSGRWAQLHCAQTVALDCARRGGNALAQAYAHRSLARACTNLGGDAEARRHIDTALHLFEQRADTSALIDTYRLSSWIAEQSGDPTTALAHARRSLALLDAGVGSSIRAATLNAVGWYHALCGQYQQALAHCTTALRLLTEPADRYSLADTWDSIGYAHFHLDEHADAIEAYSNALEHYHALGIIYAEADTTDRLGDALHAAGAYREAGECWQHSAELFARLRHPNEGVVRSKLATPVSGIAVLAGSP